MGIEKTRDDLTEGIRKLEGMGKQGQAIMGKIGLVVVEMGRRAFATPALRPAPWKPRKTKGSHALLLKTGTLRRSLRVIGASRNSVTVGSDRAYAAIHQFGGVIKPKKKKALHWKRAKKPVRQVKIPARPFLPITGNGGLSPLALKRVNEAIAAMISNALDER